jgi:hypothetical protein
MQIAVTRTKLMSRRVLALAFVVSVVTLLPAARAEAMPCLDLSSPTCMPVAQFEWADDDFFGPILTLVNLTDPLADEALTDVVLWVDLDDGSGPVNINLIDSSRMFGAPYVSSILPDSSGIGTQNFDLFGLQFAAVDFIFRGVAFSSALTAMTLTGADAVRIGFDTAAAASVPEPSLLLLMGLGAGGMLLRRRQRTS